METNNLSVTIKNVGSWSNTLYQQLSSSSLEHLNVSVEGPYGPHTKQFLRLVLISFILVAKCMLFDTYIVL